MPVDGVAGQPVTLPLSRGPATGYGWHLELPAGVTRLEDGPGQPPPADQALGGGTGARLRVVAAPGRYRITATLARPWQRDAPIETVVLDLTIR